MTFSPLIAVGVALAVSLAGNAALLVAYLEQRDATVETRGERDRARDDAKQCSDGVLSLQAAAEQRAKEAEAARAVAEGRLRAAQRTAGNLMKKKPAIPADLCASAQVQIDEWLSNRGAK